MSDDARLVLPDPSPGGDRAVLYSLDQQLNQLAGKEQQLTDINAAYDKLASFGKLTPGQAAQREKFIGELQQVRAEQAQQRAQQAQLREQQREATQTGQSRHVANESDWKAVCTAPDYCKVGNSVVPFDSFAIIDKHTQASPNVKAQGKSVYRVGDMHKGVKADAGQHIVAQTSQGSGYVKFLTGQDNVKVNGLPIVRHDSKCLVNCNAAGVGGAMGRLMTEQKSVSSEGESGASNPDAPPGERTSPKLEELKRQREALEKGT